MMQPFLDWYQTRSSQIQQDYFRFLQMQSISADPSYREDMLHCAEFLLQYLQDNQLKAELLPTSSYPIVYAEDLSAGPDLPTLLIYGHYDVQPADPIELWKSPPFQPTIREGKVFARGASDNKGQIFYTIIALICYKQLFGSLPVNLKLCIEGEEESHSKGLSQALPLLKEKLKTDALLIVDFDSKKDGSPSVTLGARGCIALEVTVTGANRDLHSGFFGGLAYNPLRALSEMLASFWDENGRVAVPHFYDGIHLQDIEAFTFDLTKEDLKEEFGIGAFSHPRGCSLKESNWFLPTLEINGVHGGYAGEGSKTVIPSSAYAKLTCRLVPGQDPMTIGRSIEAFLKKIAPEGMQVMVDNQGGAGAFRGHIGSSLARAVQDVTEKVTGKQCHLVLSGASIPIVAELAHHLSCDVVGMGYALASDDIHAPNEHFDMERFKKGFLTVAGLMDAYAKSE